MYTGGLSIVLCTHNSLVPCWLRCSAVQLNQLVQEKERKLRLLLRISGVSDTAMWFSWWIVFTLIAAWSAFGWFLWGYAFDNKAIAKSDFSVIFVSHCACLAAAMWHVTLHDCSRVSVAHFAVVYFCTAH